MKVVCPAGSAGQGAARPPHAFPFRGTSASDIGGGIPSRRLACAFCFFGGTAGGVGGLERKKRLRLKLRRSNVDGT